MELGMIGLGGTGLNLVKRLLQGGQEVVGHNRPAPRSVKSSSRVP
jgi:6-phosphogluconate dehydrogenase (decarboxylating)